MIYISDRLKIRLDDCFNIDFNNAKIIAIAKGENYDDYFKPLYDNQKYMFILYYVNNKFLRLIVNNDNTELYASFMEKTDKTREDYDFDKDRYRFYGQAYNVDKDMYNCYESYFSDVYFEYEKNALYLTEYDGGEYMDIMLDSDENNYRINYHNSIEILKNKKDNPLFNFSDIFVLYKLGGKEAYEALIEEKLDYEIKF